MPKKRVIQGTGPDEHAFEVVKDARGYMVKCGPMKQTSIRLPSKTTEVEINEVAVRAKISTYLAAKSNFIGIEDERTTPTFSCIDDKEMQPSAVVVSRTASYFSLFILS